MPSKEKQCIQYIEGKTDESKKRSHKFKLQSFERDWKFKEGGSRKSLQRGNIKEKGGGKTAKAEGPNQREGEKLYNVLIKDEEGGKCEGRSKIKNG